MANTQQPMVTPAALGASLAAQRKALGYTQGQTAALVGLNTKTISHLENHPQKASVETLFKALAALNLQLALQERATGHTAQGEW